MSEAKENRSREGSASDAIWRYYLTDGLGRIVSCKGRVWREPGVSASSSGYLADDLSQEGVSLEQVGEFLSLVETSGESGWTCLRCRARGEDAVLIGRRLEGDRALVGLGGIESLLPEALDGAMEWARTQRETAAEPRVKVPVLKALVVDHNVHRQEIAKALLRKLGCRTRGANSAGEALALAKGVAFDVALIDEEVPGLGMVGLGELMVSRSRTLWGFSPFLALVGDAAKVDGFDAVLGRPLGMEELQRAVELARREREARDLKFEFLEGLPVVEMSAWLDESVLLSRLAKAFLAQGRELIRTIERPWAERVTDVEMEIRSLKNGADILQARRLSAVCQKVLLAIEVAQEENGALPDLRVLGQEFERFTRFAAVEGLLREGDSGLSR